MSNYKYIIKYPIYMKLLIENRYHRFLEGSYIMNIINVNIQYFDMFD